jgi:signal transduction histidine kinase
MRSFLGVPIIIRGEPFGNLYLTEKEGSDFDASDEAAAVVLADFAAVALHNARLYTSAERRRAELERAVAGLEATVDISRAVGGETDLARVLELIVKRGRALVEARALVILLREGEELVVAATAGELKAGQRGVRLGMDGTAAEQVIETRSAMRVSDVAREMSPLTTRLGLDATTALVAPLTFRGHVLGVIQAYDRMVEGPVFSARDEMLLQSFGASAAVAVATAQSVERGRLEQTVEAAEQERSRWARELHDETLQSLGAVRLMLSTALRSQELETAVPEVVDELQRTIDGLRTLITELRPAVLDELGLGAAVESLLERMTADAGLDVALSIDLDQDSGRAATRLAPELENAAYRIVQEALNNALRHAQATRVTVEVTESEGEVSVSVRDDGRGFDRSSPGGGFGLLGMRERVDLAGGRLSVDTTLGEGTSVVARFAVRRVVEPKPAEARDRA